MRRIREGFAVSREETRSMASELQVTKLTHGAASEPKVSVPKPRVDLDAAFRQHARFLARAVSRLLGPSAPVEDIVQQCFLVAHRRSDTLEDGPTLRGWLYRTCVHLVAHERRSFARRNRLRDALTQPPPSIQTADELVEAARARERLHRALARLPLKVREVFVLYEMEGMTAPEIAALLGVAQGTIWRRAHQARALFERAWEEQR